ncbi:hypothetical protein ACGFI3_07020 [Nonomuraea wenchangensis]|uniref:hypothetical protein n=1 Tax=Nonomuraea wenchangensis TaxID=568860 RepID=UPI00371DD982
MSNDRDTVPAPHEVPWPETPPAERKTNSRIAWLESPSTVQHTRWYDQLSRPYTWQLPMFWLKNDIDNGEELTAMTVPVSAYDDPQWRPL